MTSRTLIRITFFSVGAVLLLATSLSAQPQSNLWLNVGWFPTQFNTSANLFSNDGTQSNVDLENDLGLASNASNVRFEGLWRFKPRHRLEFGFTSWNRSSDIALSRQITWRDRTYDVGVPIHSSSSAQFIRLGYRYSLYRTETTEFDVAGSIDALWSKFSLDGTATITRDDGTQVTGNYKTEESYIAPAPVIGFGYSHMITPQWLLRTDVEFLKVKIEKTTAKVLDARVFGDYYFNPRWGAGVGYTYVGYKVERARFDAKYDFSGPVLYGSYRR